jgi:uncharacterized protein YndB with AHSA1/START domain
MEKTKITVEANIAAPVDKVWKAFNDPQAIMAWNSASPDWHTPKAENDLRPGGSFNYRMEAKDGSAGFDLRGTYDEVVPNEFLSFTLEDGRTVEADFMDRGGKTHVTETFEAESENPIEMQRGGWQAILDSFKAYVEKRA